MRRQHFAALRPVCPVCRAASLAISSVIRENGDTILEGILGCENRECSREYPVIDGIPVIVGAIRAWLAANPLQVLLRDDLSSEIESVIGDMLGPGSTFDTLRQHVGIYAAAHYETDGAVRVLEHALSFVGEVADGPAIDIGCAVGATTFALAQRHRRLAVGIDLNFAMLRAASQVLREGRLRWAQRRVGLVYDRRELQTDPPARDLVDFWCCDASALPFADGTFALAASLNVIDVVPAPRQAIAECGRVLRTGGTALIATPYDWTPTATSVEQWLGGHSQRGEQRGSSEPMLRALLAEQFDVHADEEHVPWRLRLHDRSSVEYDLHLVVASRR